MECGSVLHTSLQEHMYARWKNRPVDILFIENPALNACAQPNGSRDRICIFSGAVEGIYGTILGLLSSPEFFPDVGNISAEVTPNISPNTGFPRIPLLADTSCSAADGSIYYPNDQTRVTAALILAELALEFLIYHEIGHVVGGHLELIQNGQCPNAISEFENEKSDLNDRKLRQVFECDADAFACHVTASIHTDKKMAAITCDIVNACNCEPIDFALLTYLAAIGVLFRAMYPRAASTICKYNADVPHHPHPAVRACLVAASTMGRGLFDGVFTVPRLEEIVGASVGNIERVWADLCLPGQNPEPSEIWSQNVGNAAMQLFRSYGNFKSLLDQFARIPRQWDDWQWPEMERTA